MSAALLAVLAVLLYAAAEAFAIGHLLSRRPGFGRLTNLALLAALAAQFFAMEAWARQLRTVPYRTLAGSMALFAWMLAATYLLLVARHRERSLGPFLIPLIILFSATSLAVSTPARPAGEELRGSVFAFHVTIAMLAYAAFTLSFVLSILYLVQNRQLRRRQTGLLFARLPALDVIERMNRTSVVVGVAALAVAIALGIIWAGRVWGSVWDAKILWACLTIGIYGFLLVIESRGWTGPRAARVSIAGFAIVLFSYTVANLFLSRLHTFR